MTKSTGGIRAGGGVLWRPHDDEPRVALVHRPRYDDWSLPKGKAHRGEGELAAAVREVHEETGSRVAVSRRLRAVRYRVDGADKQVDYWAMRHLGGRFTANDEVDEIAWLAPKAARERLTYDHDRSVLDDFTAVPVPETVILLVRHAKAGKRSEWQGDDDLRPLEPAGQAQAERLVDLLSVFAPERVLSADPVRCVQTVRPLADRFGLELTVTPVFGDESFEERPRATEKALLALAVPGPVTVVASQGATIPALIDRFGRDVASSSTRKAAVWALTVVDGEIVASDYYEDALR
ncbi:MAG: NUDIX hydrolase [Actinobacteria bacterium]|nr:NUDIX hydrolase [Actinomycetota bacterium]